MSKHFTEETKRRRTRKKNEQTNARMVRTYLQLHFFFSSSQFHFSDASLNNFAFLSTLSIQEKKTEPNGTHSCICTQCFFYCEQFAKSPAEEGKKRTENNANQRQFRWNKLWKCFCMRVGKTLSHQTVITSHWVDFIKIQLKITRTSDFC